VAVSALPAAPGVRRQDVSPPVAVELATGVPVVLGYAVDGPVEEPVAVSDPAAVTGAPDGWLGATLAAFFANGGVRCHVVRLDDAADPVQTLARGLAASAAVDEADLVCAPDASRPPSAAVTADPDDVILRQRLVLEHCAAAGTRLALLDSLPGAAPADVLDQAAALEGEQGALYYPWPVGDGALAAPPCGYVAGVIARVDRATGVYAAPANALLEGARDLERALDDAAQAPLNAAGVNCLRAFPGRGIRVWGARTLSADPAWQYLNVRRLVTTLARRLAATTRDLAFEPNAPATWARLQRMLTALLDDLYRRGALAGASPAAAYQVRCDETTNPPATRDAGRLAADVLLAPAPPAEQVLVRLVRHPAGVSVETAAP
jgi:hypothetical protein